MQSRIKSPMMMLAVVMTLAIVTMACGLSVGNRTQPGSPVQIPGFPQGQNQSVPTLAPVPTLADGATAAPNSDTANTPSAQIPSTGAAGDLAQPVATAPKDLTELYSNVNPGVVSVMVRVNQNGQSGAGTGSGFIFMTQGAGAYIVTNHHVVEGAETVVVRFYNNSTVQAKVVGDDPNADLAVLQVAKIAQGAHALPLGDSNNVKVGETVVAIGNPFAVGTTMTSGIVSAVGREIPSGFTQYNIPQVIQTDAAINPGNSGGPLINMGGEIIGVNAQIQTGGSGNGSVGIGFAIPVNIVKLIYPSLIQKGSYTWPVLGVSSPATDPFSVDVNDTEAQKGAPIAEVTAGGPAAQAGLRQGDVVIQADGQKITSFDDMLSYIAYKRPGDKVTLTVLRNGQQGQVTVTLGTRSNEVQPTQ